MDYIYLMLLCITHAAFYYMGKRDAGDQTLGEDAQLELAKYRIDAYYAHERWNAERSDTHE